jgi:ADP-heptose:LPS heptosyltransferase/GT2 family glycosyltransferase
MTDYPEERSASGPEPAASIGERHLILSAAIDLIEVDLAAGVCRVVKGGIRGSVNAEGALADVSVLLQADGYPVVASGQLQVSKEQSGRRQTLFEVELLGCILPLAAVASLLVRTSMYDGESSSFKLELPLPVQLAQPFVYLPRLRLNVEQADLDNTGTIRVVGWIVALSPIVAVQIKIDDQKVGVTEAKIDRDDVAATFPLYPKSRLSGFIFITRLSADDAAKVKAIRVEGFAEDSSFEGIEIPVRRLDTIFEPTHPGIPSVSLAQPRFRSALPLPSEPSPQRSMFFHCDDIKLSRDGRMIVEGWAAAMAPIVRIDVAYDSVSVGSATIGFPRQDVGRLYPAIPSASKAGFRFSDRVSVAAEGVHLVSLRFETSDGNLEILDLDVIAGDLDPCIEEVLSADALIVCVDDLMITNGRAARLITTGFNLVGWSIAREGIAEINVEIDGVFIGKAYYGMRREDIERAFPDWPAALLSGFALAIPAKLLKDGTSTFRIISHDNSGRTAELLFEVDIKKGSATSGPQILRRKIPFAEVLAGRHILDAANHRPSFTFLLRVKDGKSVLSKALKTLRSLLAQSYEDWKLVICGLKQERIAEWKAAFADEVDPDDSERISYSLPCEMMALAAADETLVVDLLPSCVATIYGILEAGDDLACDSLLALSLANVGKMPAELLYGDDRRRDPNTDAISAFFKPDWTPDLLLSQNYIGRCWFATAALMRRSGIKQKDLVDGKHFDAVLRLTEMAHGIRHVPRVLLEEATQSSESRSSERNALRAALRRRCIKAEVLPGCSPHIFRVKRSVGQSGRVSIIMPSIGARDLIKVSISSIRRITNFKDYEIIVVDNIRGKNLTQEQRARKKWFRANSDLVIPVDEPFNWSRLNNIGAEAATGEYLLFLNDDVEVLDPEWIDVMMEHAQRPDVGVVGPLLLYPDRKVQHAGLFLSRKNIGTARHAFRFASEDDIGYFGLARTQRNMIGVTGACMMVHRRSFDGVMGFNERHSIINNDLDFCLRMRKSGRLVVYTPHTSLIHHELASRAAIKDKYDATHFMEDWGALCLEGDPFYNRNLTSDHDDLSFEDEPLREVYAGFPIGDLTKIRRILAIKLDHIGDMVTALPAMRRLKQRFPQAHLTALVGRSAVGIARMERAIDEVIDFEFFEARSSLGTKKLTKKDYQILGDRLAACRFDLALDLRKLGDTRHVLKYSGAPILAGIDTAGLFPWLDYTDEWEGDPLYLGKRNHVSADLINFVDGLANAFETDRRAIVLEDGKALPRLSQTLEGEFAELFASDYACIHPASGTPMRQWPPEYFAMLIDLLVQTSGIKVALLGGPDELEIAQQVLDKVRSQHSVYNLVGRSRLMEVPIIMVRSVLFVGNNSGPQHIAAGLGVPTVGVHSGVIASEEWGPLGSDAVALRRDLDCSPCYRGKVEDCHRSLACVRTLPPHWVYEVCQKLLLLRGDRSWSQSGIQGAA